jgi:hypothetical protein
MDWRRNLSADRIVRRVTSRLRGGAILFHDSGGAEGAPEGKLEALPDMIREARRGWVTGLSVIAVSES